jgi:putative intracellular protease/amidase
MRSSEPTASPMRRANEILSLAPAYFAQAELDRRWFNRYPRRLPTSSSRSRFLEFSTQLTKGDCMKILLVLTSHDQLGDTGKKTGFWLEELAAPYYVFKDAGAEITLASPNGGQPPLDPKSDEPDAQTQDTRRFRADKDAMQALATTKQLASMRAEDFDAVFYPGGHGPLWDLAQSDDSKALMESMFASGKPVAAVCHAPGVLRNVKAPDGTPLVKGKRVTGFTNTEEAAVGLTNVVPFLVEDMLKSAGGNYSKGADWQSYVLTDGMLITGQNPQSSGAAAKALIQVLEESAVSHGDVRR